MATETFRSQGPGLATQPRDAAAARARPVLYWSALGVFFIGLQTYIFSSWLLSGDVEPIDTGVTPVPDYMKFLGHGQEIAMGVGMVAMFFFLVARPKRRTGELSFDGLLFLAMFWLWWQDPLYNYVTNGFQNGSVLWNVSSWAGHIPGWNAPNADRIPHPLMWDLGFYLLLGVAAIILASNGMKKVKAKRPQTTTPVLLFGTFVFFVIADVILELFFIVSGVYTYGGIADGWALFGGEYYQFPLYEPIGVGVLCTGWTAVRYFRDDRGHTLAERGIERVNVPTRGKTFVRFLSLVGILNVVFLIGYSVFIQAWQIHPGEWPKDIQERSYFTNGLCGAGSTHACTGSDVAIPRTGSIHISPDGKVVVPRGVEPPRTVPLKTTE